MNITFPDWSKLTPEMANEQLPRLLEDSEKAIAAIESSMPTTYEKLVLATNDATRKLWELWSGVSHMLGVMNSTEWREVEEKWQPLIVSFSLRVGQSKKLYESAKGILSSVADGTEQLDPTKCRILEKMVQGAELSRVGLNDEKKKRFNEIHARLAKLGADFYNAVIDATKAFSHQKDGVTYTIDDANYPETMKQCADREVRETLYRARALRAPENAPLIAEILKLREEEASILAFGNYAKRSLASKCAPSVETVMKMINGLDDATKTPCEKEDKELFKFAEKELPRLEPWDYAFYAERLREEKYAYSEEELKKHFELSDVISGLFRISNHLFGIDIEEFPKDARPSVWHDDVRFFAVKESGNTIAHFYFDPFVRNGLKSGGAWMNDLRRRYKSEDGTVLPLALVVTNFPKPDENGKCLLPLREVETLFHEFGHALQAMLTRVDDEDAAGTGLIEWDAIEVASQFMENWCLDDRTGISFPDELKTKVRAAKNFRSASACRRQLSFAKTDIVLHSGFNGSANDIKKEIFAHFNLPMIEEDKFLCSFTHIFAGGYAAGYYGYKWSEVMSADCYGAFEESGLANDDLVQKTGKRFRDTVLALGGSRPALEVFRLFRGRDPEINALLRQMDLQ